MEQLRPAVGNISDIIHNPLYTGIGPFPRIIGDDLWVRSMMRSAEKNGPEHAYLKMTEAVEKSFGIPVMAEMRSKESLTGLRKKINRVGTEHFFANLLKSLRKSLAPLA